MPLATEHIEIPAELSWAHPVTAEWFVTKFGTPTEPQVCGWPSILAGKPTLISAPTGSGKTLAAFLVCIDRLLRATLAGELAPGTQVVYVLRSRRCRTISRKTSKGRSERFSNWPRRGAILAGDSHRGAHRRHPAQRARGDARNPPHILVTTPESLYILLTAGKSREHLRHVHTVIVDEIHAVADDKRGAHLALSLERLDALVCGENRLSPGAFLTGLMRRRSASASRRRRIRLNWSRISDRCGPARKPATIVQLGQRRHGPCHRSAERRTRLGHHLPHVGRDLRQAGRAYTEPSLDAGVRQHAQAGGAACVRAANGCAELGTENVAAHHGSLSRALRLDAEQRLKRGEIKILVATASLELGIDIGDVDLVCQIASTRAVAVAMQRVGRAGHWRGAIPKGRLFATTRDDLLEQAALVRKMRAGELDQLEIPPQPIDVLMQQMVAACGAESWEEDSLYEVLRRAYPYRDLTREQFEELVESAAMASNRAAAVTART